MKTKFIATVDENKIDKMDQFTNLLQKDGITINHASHLFGTISGSANQTVDELQKTYQSHGLEFEPDRQVNLK